MSCSSGGRESRDLERPLEEPARELLDHREQVERAERLAQVGVGPGSPGRRARAFVAAGEHDDADVPRSRVPLQLLAETEAALAGQPEVEHDDVRPVRGDPCPRRRNAGRLVDLDVDDLERRPQQDAEALVVVHDEDAYGSLAAEPRPRPAAARPGRRGGGGSDLLRLRESLERVSCAGDAVPARGLGAAEGEAGGLEQLGPAVSASAGNAAIPPEAVGSLRPRRWRRRPASTRLATSFAASLSPGTTIASSSPPSRYASSVARKARVATRATSRSTSSPAA